MNLGEMERAALPVPPGFVLVTPAYHLFVESNRLGPGIESILDGLDYRDSSVLEPASSSIRSLFEAGTVPDQILEALYQAYAEMCEGTVAVRSSATAEDLPYASFAGQQDTYLNINGRERLLSAVKSCWSSLWTARALSYRARQEIPPSALALAVVVQRLVFSEASGVMFTANPVNGRRDQLVIDGTWGLGEALVSGQVNPDHWVVEKESGLIVSTAIADKKVMTRRTEDGVESVETPASRRKAPSLSGDEISELVDIGLRVEERFGQPQDVEWALAGGRIYLVQSRPITSLFPLPEPKPRRAEGPRVYVCGNLMQGLVEPITPMGISAFSMLARGIANLWGFRIPPGETPPAFKTAAGRVFIDVTTAVRHTRTRGAVLTVTSMVDKPTSQALGRLLERDRRYDPLKQRLPLRYPWRFILRVLSRAVYTFILPAAGRAAGIRAMDRQIEMREREAARLEGIGERLAFVERTMRNLLPVVFTRMGAVLIPGMASRFIVEGRLAAWLGESESLQPVLRSLPHNPTTEMDLRLWKISRELKSRGEAPSTEHPLVVDFLESYGHRGVREIDTGMPRWKDDPTHILNVLNTYLSHGEEADVETHFLQGVEAAEKAVDELVIKVREKAGALRAALAGVLLRRVRELFGVREYPKFYLVRVIALIREVIEGVGSELVRRGELENPEDVFYLSAADIRRGAGLRDTANKHREGYRRELDRRSVPRIITSEGETVYSTPASEAGALVGTPASPGVYEGRARVVFDPREARLEPGEVLVAQGTDPAWTPLFLSAGALVMEIGGIMSHGSVVAREYGIPAVVGVMDATRLIQSGQRIRVDGEHGQVQPLRNEGQ
ncbi:MAG: phosphoenolpyruvate synthase [Firmicutes bacterium]|nr:phosphoenolpyruvate synthase [Bacillota bacterium]